MKRPSQARSVTIPLHRQVRSAVRFDSELSTSWRAPMNNEVVEIQFLTRGSYNFQRLYPQFRHTRTHRRAAEYSTVSIVTWLRSGRSRVCFLAETGDLYLLRIVQSGSGPVFPPIQGPLGSLPGRKAAGGWRDARKLATRLRMNGAIPLLPLHAFKVRTAITSPFLGPIETHGRLNDTRLLGCYT